MADRDRLVRFAEFGFAPDTGEITVDGVSVARLQEQPSSVLEALTARPGQLVTRDELQRLLWPENSLVDVENGLNIAVNKIRLALGDAATHPRFVQTVPRRGYRFIGEIAPAAAVQTAAPFTSAPRAPGTSSHITGIRFGSLLALCVAVLIVWYAPSRGLAIQSLAVMPFTNFAGDRGLDEAVDSLMDTVATGLAARGVPRVVSGEVTARYRNSNVSPAQIAQDLHADAVVFGAVVRDGAGYAVNVRLVDARTARHLWTRRFTRATTTELTFAEDISSGVMAVLRTSGGPAISAGLVLVPNAMRDEYLHQRYANLETPQDDGAAVEHLTRAIEDDRTNAVVWAGLADVYASGAEVPSRLFIPWPGPVEAGVRAARQAIRLDPSFAEPHVALGQLRMIEWRWGDAEREFAEAVRLSPRYAGARQWYAVLLLRLQKCAPAIGQAGAGIAIDPSNSLSVVAAGRAFAACGQPERAVATFSDVLATHPEYAYTHLALAGTYLRMGDVAASLPEFEKADKLRPEQCEMPARMVGVLEQLGRHAEARLQAARVATYARFEPSIQYCTALGDAGMGDLDGAFAALGEAVASHDQRILFLLTDPQLAALRPDPRWRRLLARTGLAPYAQPTEPAPAFQLLKQPR